MDFCSALVFPHFNRHPWTHPSIFPYTVFTPIQRLGVRWSKMEYVVVLVPTIIRTTRNLVGNTQKRKPRSTKT